MRVAEFSFELPEDLIAQTPSAARGASRMLVLDRSTSHVTDDHFRHLVSYLRPGDLLIVNDSRVLPARLFGVRAGLAMQAGSPRPSGQIEVLLLEPASGGRADTLTWRALVRPARKVLPGERLQFSAPGEHGEPVLHAEVLAAGEFGERVLRFAPVPDLTAVLERIGHLPLPPYIHRPAGAPDTPTDRERYQTVYAEARGGARERSAAAPTAGLHFTPEILSALEQHGVAVEAVTLHVGLGTFQPVRVAHTEDIRLHAERYTLPARTAAAVDQARAEGRRVIAVGTTATRVLEHCALQADRQGSATLIPGSGTTSIFLGPGSTFRVLSGLLTNFHLPESTLLILVSALAGRDAVLAAYAHAVSQRYRFFSYGDCMLIL